MRHQRIDLHLNLNDIDSYLHQVYSCFYLIREQVMKLHYNEISFSEQKTDNFAQRVTFSFNKDQPEILLKGAHGTLSVTYHDLAVAAWGIYQNINYFRRKCGIFPRYRSDFNGGGNQLIEIRVKDSLDDDDCILRVVYSTYGKEDYIYEADLIADGRRDYHPVRNHGKRKFMADFTSINVETSEDLLSFMNGRYLSWIETIKWLSKPHETLDEWVGSGFDMGVKCPDFTCAHISNIQNGTLASYLALGVDLEALSHRLSCSKCQRREPFIWPE